MKKQKINKVYIQEHENGLSLWDIANKYNDTYRNVVEAITGKRFEARLLPIEEKKRICELYISGISTVKLGEMYGTKHKPMAAVLEEFGIKRTGVGRRIYGIDEEYFDVIDTPNKAYVLGFLSADGSNNPKKQTVSMSLEECDREILEKIRIEMRNEHPLEYIDYSSKHDFGYTYKNQYRMLIFSKKICDSLTKLGVIQNKSLTLTFANIDQSLIKHYVRGLIDGDGSFGVHDTSVLNNRNINVSLTSTFNVCNTFADIVTNELGIYCTVKEASNKNGLTAVASICRQKDIKTFLDWIYDGADLFLKRKHDIYLEYYKKEDCTLSA